MYVNKEHKESSDDFKSYDGPSRDQILVRLGKACNFKCTFCNIADNERRVKKLEGYLDIVSKLLYKVKHSPVKRGESINFTISGGEPTLFKKEFLFSLKYIKSLCLKKGIIPKFDVQTNASCVDPIFYKKVHNLGLERALVSFHSIKKESFEKIIGIPFNQFDSIVEGIKVLYNTGIEVSLNIVINRVNYLEFEDIIQFVLKNFPFINKFYLGFVQPHGDAQKNMDSLVIDYKTVEYFYNKGIYLLLKNGKSVTSHYVGLPACFITKKKISLDVSENINLRKKYSFNERYFINKINDVSQFYKKDCRSCMNNNICSGLWSEYLNIQGVKPIPYYNYFIKNTPSYSFLIKEYVDYNKLKQIFDSNKKHLFIYDEVGIDDIKLITKNSIKIGYYKISLLISNLNIKYNSLLYSGITNYQFKIDHLSLSFFNLVYNFNKNLHGPQFKIYLDIYVKNLDNDLKEKLDYILLKNKNDFVNIFSDSNYDYFSNYDEDNINII